MKKPTIQNDESAEKLFNAINGAFKTGLDEFRLTGWQLNIFNTRFTNAYNNFIKYLEERSVPPERIADFETLLSIPEAYDKGDVPTQETDLVGPPRRDTEETKFTRTDTGSTWGIERKNTGMTDLTEFDMDVTPKIEESSGPNQIEEQ